MAQFNKDEWIIIGISGVTCGGKTTLANKLADSITPVYTFHQDTYFYPDDSPNHVKCSGLEHNNYDILSSVDMSRMYGDVTETLSGREPARTTGRTTGRQTGRPAAGRLAVDGKNFLIVEGFTVLNYKPLLEICDLRYYIVLEYGECLARRALRLYEPPDVPGYLEQCVWPEHIKYRAEIEQDKRVKIVDGSRPDNVDYVVADVKALGATVLPELPLP